MNDTPAARYVHREKLDGSHDSICLACLQTISSQRFEDDLAREEEDHVCRYSFPIRRAVMTNRRSSSASTRKP